MGSLRTTASLRYKQTKRKANKPLLPGDISIIRDIEKEKINKESSQPNKPLEVIGQLNNFTPLNPAPKLSKTGSDGIDICLAVSCILSRMWSEFPRNSNDTGYALPAKLLSETYKFRNELPKAVTLAQLYGVFPNYNTLVDKAVSRECSNGSIRLIPVNTKDSSSLDLIIKSKDFFESLDPINPEFAHLCRSKPEATWFSLDDLKDIDISAALNQGFLTLDLASGVHRISVPNKGSFLKLERLARTWLVKCITQGNRKFKELPETTIEDRMVTPKKYWSDLKGVTLEWILYDSIGGGWIDGFETPIGRGWKVLQ